MHLVDPAEKQRIDDRIKTAKTALAVIEEETNRLSEEDAELQKDDKEYRKNHVSRLPDNPFLLLISYSRRLLLPESRLL